MINATEARNETNNYCCKILSEIVENEIRTAITKQLYTCTIYFFKRIGQSNSHYDMFVANESKFYTKMQTELGYVVSHEILDNRARSPQSFRGAVVHIILNLMRMFIQMQ